MQVYLYFLICLFFPWLALAACGEPTFGFELTFTGSRIPNDPSAPNAKQRANRIVSEWTRLGKAKAAKYASGNVSYGYNFSFDPEVVEVRPSSGTTADIEKRACSMEDVIFQVARELQLAPSRQKGGGHVHIGIDAFKSLNEKGECVEDPLLFRDFLVDYISHPELCAGGFYDSPYNSAAATLGTSAEDAQKRAAAANLLIQKFDAFHQHGQGWSIAWLAQTFQNNIYEAMPHPHPGRMSLDADGRKKYRGLNVTKIANEAAPFRTVELRCFHAQDDAGQLIATSNMLRGRIQMLRERRKSGNIPQYNGARVVATDIHTPQHVIRTYRAVRSYVEGSGSSWPGFVQAFGGSRLFSASFEEDIQRQGLYIDREGRLCEESSKRAIEDVAMEQFICETSTASAHSAARNLRILPGSTPCGPRIKASQRKPFAAGCGGT